MWSKLIPLFVLAIVILAILALVLYQARKSRDLETEAELEERANWDGVCESMNPDTGAVCQRVEYHSSNHYRELPNGNLVTWK